MKTSTSPFEAVPIGSSDAYSQKVNGHSEQTRAGSIYATLLEGPVASLISDAVDHPDVQSVAILGYN